MVDFATLWVTYLRKFYPGKSSVTYMGPGSVAGQRYTSAGGKGSQSGMNTA